MSTRPNAATHVVSSSKPPPPRTNKAPDSLIHPQADLSGTHPITIGPKAIVQLRSCIDSTHGPVTIGAGTIIAERAKVGYQSPPSPTQDASTNIGEGVVIESGAVVEAASIADYTIIEVRANVGKGAVIGRNCKVCAGVTVGNGEHVEDGMVIWGDGWDRRRVEREWMGLSTGGARKGVVEALGEGTKVVWSTK